VDSLQFIENLKSIDLQKVAATVLQKNADVYTEFNREQMMKGKRKDGKNIGDSPGNYYLSLMYARDKAKMNSAAGFMNPDLRLTGSFQDQMYMNVKGEDIIMDSTDSKATELVKKYGSSIYGINPSEEFTDFLEPDFQAEITRQTGLKFN